MGKPTNEIPGRDRPDANSSVEWRQAYDSSTFPSEERTGNRRRRKITIPDHPSIPGFPVRSEEVLTTAEWGKLQKN